MIYRQLLAFLLSFVLIFSSTSALAASPAGWTATAADAVMAGATATITAFKGSGSTAMKAVISHKPTAVAVGKELVKGGGVIALAYAMSKLLDAGIDWVMTEGGEIKYKDVSVGTGSSSESSSPFYALFRASKYYSAQDACKAWAVYNRYDPLNYSGSYVPSSDPSSGSSGSFYCTNKTDGLVWSEMPLISNPAYDPSAGADSGYKSIPIDTVAAKVIANAEAGHAESQDFVKAVAVGAVDAGELDTALDAVAEPTTDTANPDAPPTDPTKPFDPSGILDALKKILAALGLLSVLGTISDSLTAMLDWFKSEPDKPEKPEDNKIDIPEPPLPDIDSTISFGGACPADLGADFNLYGTNFNFVLMPFSKLCPLLSTFVKPTLILLGSFMAVAIVGGRKDA